MLALAVPDAVSEVEAVLEAVTVLESEVDAVAERVSELVRELVLLIVLDTVEEGVAVAEGEAGAWAMPRNCVKGAAWMTGAPPFSHVNEGTLNAYTLKGVITNSVTPSELMAACVTLTSLVTLPPVWAYGDVGAARRFADLLTPALLSAEARHGS